MIAPLLARLEHWLFEPPESIIGRPLWKLTRILRYPYALMRDITRGDLTLRAMSLVYTTLLSGFVVRQVSIADLPPSTAPLVGSWQTTSYSPPL